jgi:hypothetical protein
MANAPAVFRNLINEMLKDMIDLGIVSYIEDKLIYCQTKEQHEKLIREILSSLQH